MPWRAASLGLPMPPSRNFRPSRRHADLGRDYFDIVEAASFPHHQLRYRNQHWAERVGLGTLTEAEWDEHFGRFEPLPGSFAAPLALRYHGHQFQTYNPQLGDGRGFLFAQLHDWSTDGCSISAPRAAAARLGRAAATGG